MIQLGKRPHLLIHCRWLVTRDHLEVIAISQSCAGPPWTNEDLIFFRSRNANLSCVAIHDEKVVGYYCYGLEDDCFDVVDFAVHPEFRRKGIGAQMMAELWSRLGAQRKRITCEVRDSSLGAHLFLRDQGFLATEVFRQNYQETGEDGYLFVRESK